MGDETPKDFTGLAVAIGVVQEGQRNILQAFTDFKAEQVKAVDDVRAENVTNRTEIEGVKTRLTVIESRERPRAPWYVVVGGIAAILAACGTGVGLFVTLSQLASAIAK
ncbi:hypothetical protein [Leifsonia aquatica]|uniref:hypothetical protein n=1 Tax=Leifsonia aquatica TaxID=144185 RepID=UPI0004689A24|nr:hypothetical protein [Leifsonia aquatica]